jgi:hypothetical protein
LLTCGFLFGVLLEYREISDICVGVFPIVCDSRSDSDTSLV